MEGEERRTSPSRGAVLAVVAAFVVTRSIGIFFAFDEQTLGASFGDLEKYQQWSQATIGQDQRPYEDVPVEYPPGVLPFIALPRLLSGDTIPYSTPFALSMLGLDIAAFGVVLLLARRWGSTLGAWTWVFGVFLIGPLIYLRLDLVPALATVVAFERAAAGAWAESGGWMGFGTVAKIYPAFLLPSMVALAPRRITMVLWAAGVALVFVAPSVVAGAGPELWRDVIGYHGDRGIHVESTWGFLLLASSKLGRAMTVNFQFGANEALTPLVIPMKAIAAGLSVGSVVLAAVVARAYGRRGDAYDAALVAFGCLALLMGFGTVFSPQYAIWLIALAAVVLTKRQREPSWLHALSLSALPIAALTQLVFPRTIGDVLLPFYEGSPEAGSPIGLTVLGLRNAAVLAAGAATLLLLSRRDREPRVEEPLR